MCTSEISHRLVLRHQTQPDDNFATHPLHVDSAVQSTAGTGVVGGPGGLVGPLPAGQDAGKIVKFVHSKCTRTLSHLWVTPTSSHQTQPSVVALAAQLWQSIVPAQAASTTMPLMRMMPYHTKTIGVNLFATPEDVEDIFALRK